MRNSIITRFPDYVRFLNENDTSYSGSKGYVPEEIKRKINKVILWISINKGFYGELLSHVNIYGSSEINPRTMCTNGRDIIFHPDFVSRQSEAALRFVLIHEILHCIGDHMSRREDRNPVGWNIACDYAINPLIKDEDGIEWPVSESGQKEGLYDERFDGLRAEEIYDILKSSGELDKLMADDNIRKTVETGQVIDDDQETPDPDSDLNIQEGDYPIDSDDDSEDTDGPGEGDGSEKDPGDTGEGPDGEEKGDKGDEPGDSGAQGETGSTGNTGTTGGTGSTGPASLPKVGQKVITSDGRSGVIKVVYPNGDIEI